MKTYSCLVFALFCTLISCSQSDERADGKFQAKDYAQLKNNFKHPTTEYGVNCWWWWLNGNVNKAAITKDLEAMKARNFQGAMIFDAGGHNQRRNKDIPQGPLFGSDEWNELFVFAMDEAKRLGLEMGFNIQSGWNLGGPRVTPEFAAKQITFSSTTIKGGGSISNMLELPMTRQDFYRDIAVLAFPVRDDHEQSEIISDLNLKLGFRELGGSAPDCRFLLQNTPRNSDQTTGGSTSIVQVKEIIDLTSKMDSDGNLLWDGEFALGCS
jgi:hypothetical protein